MRIQKTFKNSLKKAQRKSSTSRRARNIARRRVVHARGCNRRSFVKCSKKVSDKLKALKSLIPHVPNGSNEIVKAEQLFQETADYIIVLKTQAFVLQKLIEFYDGSRNEQQNVQEESS
ncbi:Transcription factor bHLH151, putative [Theobroma cacao]|uniref:Transcription factor bHLH151, putative n=1 Tax=Theobroma cacao TaxID=3641 RepID=A0A061EF71_THECC|nr:Transcription factor bHLH151, putative [Theobroma cacao]